MSLGWRNLIAYAWNIWCKKFPKTLNVFRKLHWIKEDGSAKGKGVGRERDRRRMRMRIWAGVDGCPYTLRVLS